MQPGHGYVCIIIPHLPPNLILCTIYVVYEEVTYCLYGSDFYFLCTAKSITKEDPYYVRYWSDPIGLSSDMRSTQLRCGPDQQRKNAKTLMLEHKENCGQT
jgi:hypothetical protein